MNKWQKLSSYEDAVKWAYGLTRSHNKVFTNDEGIKRSRRLMELLGNPQDSVPAIHVAGTTGKGTVTYMMSGALRQAGKKVALIMSPHVYDVRERCQINNELVSKDIWLENLNSMMSALKQLEEEMGYANYYEVLFTHSCLIASRSNVDYLVVETGLGGLLDTSNTITREDKVAVICQLGMDHENILGPDIASIATQKAGIIQKHNKVFVLEPVNEAKAVIEKRVSEKKADLAYVPLKDFEEDLGQLNSQLSGDFQRSNAGLAYKTLAYVSERDGFDLSLDTFKKSLARLSLPGRLEEVKFKDLNVVFDGAHNDQKINGFVQGLVKRYPDSKFNFVIAVGNRKKLDEIMEPLLPLANKIIFTGYEAARSDMNKKAHEFTQSELKEYGAEYITNHREIAKIMKAETSKTWVVTGSFYVLGEIKEALEENH